MEARTLNENEFEGIDLGSRSAEIEAFLALMAESGRWSRLEISLDEATGANQNLCADLSRFDRLQAAALLGALLTLPEYQSSCIRLELLVALAVMHCRGQKTPNLNDVARWFSEIGKSQCVSGEDAAEDVFVTLIQTEESDYRLLEGIWESAGFYTQRIVNVIETMPNDGHYADIKRTVRAMLVVSEIVCERAGLHRYQQGSDVRHATLVPARLGRRDALIERVCIRYEDLEARGVSRQDLMPFLFPKSALADLGRQEVSLTTLDRQPFIDVGNRLIVVLPTAITTALREFVIWVITQMGAADQFDLALSAELADVLRRTQLFGDLKRPPIFWGMVGQDRLASFSVEIDRGYVIAFHIFLSSIRRHGGGGFKSVIKLSDDLQNAVQNSMRGAENTHKANPEFRKGLHLVVGCGWGKGYDATFERLSSGYWKFESLSAADLVRMSGLDGMSVRHFWRYEEGLDAAGKNGVKIVNINGVLNLLGWMRRNHGHFVPHEDLPSGRISPDRPLHISPPLNLLRDLRIEVDQSHDRHSARDHNSAWHDVQRLQPSPTFPSESRSRLYACMHCAGKRKPVALYEGRHHLWLEVDTPGIASFETHYRLWEMASEWLHRIGAVLDDRLEGRGVFGIRLIFEDDDAAIEAIEVQIPSSPIEYCSVEVLGDGVTALIRLAPGFMHAFREPKNTAESALVESMLCAVLTLSLVDDPTVLARKLKTFVVLNDAARNFHMFHAHELIDYIREELPGDLIVANATDDAITRLGLGWRAYEGEGDIIEGRDDCASLLNRVVDILVGDIVEILGRCERGATIERLLLNCLEAMRNEQQWKKTSAALIGLHGREPPVMGEIVEEISKFAGASVCGRVLIEMALCASPLERGGVPAEMELGDLMAKVSLLIRIGGLSDGIYFNALPPRLRISPLGDILFQDDFGNEVVEPTLTQAIGEAFVGGAPRQQRYYLPPEVLENTREHFGEPFWQAWIAETGVDIDQTRKILDVIEERAIRERMPILKMRKQEFLRIFEGIVEEAKVTRFLEQYGLASRPHWNKPPSGFKIQEIFPWRFGRRLSLVARPLICMDDSDDPLLLIAPSMLRRGVLYVLGSAYEGTLDQSFFVSDQMRNEWRGSAGEGHTFNHEVATALSQAGYMVREGVGLPEILRRGLDRDFGDVDVMAWKPGSNQVCVGECKDLSLARNYSEIAALLSDYQGKLKKGKPDKLLRHLERVRMLEENLSEIAKFTGIKAPVVVSALFVSGVVPMQYAKIDALKGTYVGGVDKFLAQSID